MQTVSTAFTERTQKNIRPVFWRALISFQKNFDNSISFFEIGTSTIGGTDIIKGDNSVVQEWDKYDYEDYTGKVLSIDYTREAELPTSPMTLSIATIMLDNSDDYFTPLNQNSPIFGYVKPQRPIKLYVGFKDEAIPVFVGLTTGLPIVDEKNKTVTFNCIDFLKSISNIELDTEIIYTDMLSSDIISDLLETAGLLTSQFSLDTGTTIIPFAYFRKGTKIGDALREIAEAELGSIYMDESGVIRFENRTNWNDNNQVWAFDKSTTLDLNAPEPSRIINVVEVYSNAREVQAKQKLFELANPLEIPAGGTLEIFADFKDDFGDLPVTTVDEPVALASATTSFYNTNSEQDGSGSNLNADVTLDSYSQFSTTYKMTFANAGSVTAWITALELFATPAKVVSQIYVRKEDSTSIAQYDEQAPFKVENDYIQDESTANSLAQIILSDRAELDDQRTMLVKGVPQIQVGDLIYYSDEVTAETYFVTKINGILNTSGYRQHLTVSKRTIESYFRIGISTIGGDDKIAP